MGLFGGDDDELDDAALIKAARRRLLAEIENQKAASIINNVYGGGTGSGGGGVMDHMPSPSSPGEDPYDYFVDITRKDLPDMNPNTGKPAGWEKSVHRYRNKKKAR